MFEDVFDKENEFDNILDNLGDYFDESIIERGEEYYNEGRVENVTKIGNMFVSRVNGTIPYKVSIDIDDPEDILMHCDCPCEYNCKHEVAALISISNNEYDEKELMPYVEENNLSVEDLIKKIPAEALKKYLLSDNGMKNTIFDLDDLETTFIEYIPKQDYNYYYNNLYNRFVLEDNEFELYYDYFNEIRKYIESNSYEDSFKIIKAIIEVCHDLNIDIVSDYPELGMYLRITYRKADKEVKKIIEKYIMSLIFNHYYNNVYLEDMIAHMN